MNFGAIDPAAFDENKLIESQPFSMASASVNMTDTSAINNNVSVEQQHQQMSMMQQYFSTNLTGSTNSSTTSAPPVVRTNTVTLSTDVIQTFHPDINHRENQPNLLNMSSTNSNQWEQKNQELSSLLYVEKVRNHELSVKVTQQHNTIEALSKNVEQMQQKQGIIDDLKRQLETHQQTVSILVGDKTDLAAKLQQKEQRIAEFEAESMELNGRLKASRHRVSELEKDLNTLTQSRQKYDGTRQALCTELETLQEDNKRLQRQYQEACDENTENQHQMTLKIKENDDLKQQLTAKYSELEMALLRLEQLDGNDVNQSKEHLSIGSQQHHHQQQQDTERQIIELQNMISELTNDRDRTQQQYQTYVQHLTNETATMKQRIQELTKANEKLTKREESLVDHVRDLERQFQKQISTQQRLAALRTEESNQKSQNDENKQSNLTTNVGDVALSNELKELKQKIEEANKEKSDLNVS